MIEAILQILGGILIIGGLAFVSPAAAVVAFGVLLAGVGTLLEMRND